MTRDPDQDRQPAAAVPTAPEPKQARGFTLAEVLVVLVILGIVAGLVGVVSQPDDRARLDVEAQRLAQLLDLAAVQARLGGRPIAWTADRAGYRFWQLGEDAQWTRIVDDDALRARNLPGGMMIVATRVENLPSQKSMRVEFRPYGAASAFRIDLALGEARLAVAGSPVGDIRVLREQAGGYGEPASR